MTETEKFERLERDMNNALKTLEVSMSKMQGSLEVISQSLVKTLSIWETSIIHEQRLKVAEARTKDLEDFQKDMTAKHHALEYKVIIVSTTISVGVGVGAYFIGLLLK